MTTYLLAAVLASGMAVGVDAPPAAASEAVELAARNYRIQVYDTFHADRAEYDRHIAEWTQLENSWRDAGEPADGQYSLILWLVGATTQSRPDAVGPLPELPQFAVQLPPKPSPLAVQPEQASKAPPAIDPSTAPTPKTTPAATAGAKKPVGTAEAAPKEAAPPIIEFGPIAPPANSLSHPTQSLGSTAPKSGSTVAPPKSPSAGQPAAQRAAPANNNNPTGGTYLDKLRRSVNAAQNSQHP